MATVDLVVFVDLAVEDAFVRSKGEFLHVLDSTTGIVRGGQPTDLDRASGCIGWRCSGPGGLAFCLDVLFLGRPLLETHDGARLMC